MAYCPCQASRRRSPGLGTRSGSMSVEVADRSLLQWVWDRWAGKAWGSVGRPLVLIKAKRNSWRTSVFWLQPVWHVCVLLEMT